jgi:molybdopterin synthase sulfur carrier subunit
VAVEVRLPNILRPLAGGEVSVKAEGATLREVFDDLVRQYPALAGSLLTPDGEMHRHLNVFLNDDDVRYLGRLDAKVGPSDTVTLMPAVAGGDGGPALADGGPAVRAAPEVAPQCGRLRPTGGQAAAPAVAGGMGDGA